MSEPSWAERPWENPAPGEAGTTPPKKSSPRKGCLIWAVVMLVLFVGCTVSVATNGSHNPSAPSGTDARMQCEEWVKDKLKSPSTASFSSQVVTGGPVSWTVTGSVDAENSFGAAMRSGWTCSIRLDGDMWRGSATLLE